MNRNHRRYGAAVKMPRRHDSIGKVKLISPKNDSDIEVVLSPKTKGYTILDNDKSKTNRCCYVSPDQKDFGQFTDSETFIERYQNTLLDQYGFDPITPETFTKMKEFKNVLCGRLSKIDNCSQSMSPDVSPCIATSDGSHWQNVNNTDDIERLLMEQENEAETCRHLSNNIHISDKPRVKIIAEKFCKFKKNDIELRRLDEKVVCLEYDVYDEVSTEDVVNPAQRMRAFFSVKPISRDKKDREVTIASELPSNIKNKFHINDEDLKKMTEKEIEIIDGKIEENRPYLQDLQRLLKRKQVIAAKKNKSSLDLQSLYEMAIKQRPSLDSDFSNANLLSKAELQEVKDLILARCNSSALGFNRKRLKCDNEMARETGVISESIVAVLLREEKLNVFH